jgi:hypothetical protein
MPAIYQPLAKPRFAIEQIADGEQIRVKARRQAWPMLFLPIWLAIWTVGGATAIGQVIRHFQPFLAFWLVGWIAVGGTIAWMFTGSETLRIVGSDLEVAHHALGWSRRWLFQGSQIRNLSVAPQPAWPFRFSWQMPFVMSDRMGAVRFDYGARTLYAAPGLDDAEGRLIVERLAKRLPMAARIG